MRTGSTSAAAARARSSSTAEHLPEAGSKVRRGAGGIFAEARSKFAAQWWLYCTIPVVAGAMHMWVEGVGLRVRSSGFGVRGVDGIGCWV